MANEDCGCGGLCGDCQHRTHHDAQQHLHHTESGPPIDTTTHPTGKHAPPIPTPKIADFAIVYVLGDGSKGRVIEEFAGQTGYHIRTIPQGRFSNPIMVAAGGGYLCVVDRFGTEDVLRITDKYAGAGPGGFDSDGFPLDSVDWGNLPDIKQIQVGAFVSGVQILPRGTLIATVPNGGRTTFFKYDVDGSFPLYNGLFTLPAPYDAVGDATGVPCVVDQTNPDNIHEFLATVRDDVNHGALVKVNFLENKVTGLIGLPAGIPYGVASVDNILSVMMGDASGITTVYRMERLDDTDYMVSLYSDRSLPAPESRAISKTFTTLDAPEEAPETYYGVTSTLAHNFKGPLSSAEETTPSAAVAAGGRNLGATTTDAKNDNRTPVATSYHTKHYQTLDPVPVKCQRIDNPTGAGLPTILDLDTLNNTVAELLRYISGADMDTTKPLFRFVHGKHYDYLSDGGFTYGCVSVDGSTVIPVTSALNPVSMAIDRSTEPGKLKELPDAKTALVDAKTGLLVYESIKPLGFLWYGGTMAALRLSDEAQHSIHRTGCSDVVDAAIEAYDGIEVIYTPTSGVITRQNKSIVTPTNFSTVNDGRGPWALFIPRVTPGRFSVTPYDSKPVLAKDTDGSFLPWWIGHQANPGEEIGRQSTMFYPNVGTIFTPSFSTSAQCGFFGLNWRKDRRDLGVDHNNLPIVDFKTPDSILNFRYAPLDLTPAYEAATPESVSAGLPVLPPLTPFTAQSGLGQESKLRRAAIFDTDIRSWVGVELKLDRGGILTDGQGDWVQPAAWDNGLGIPIGPSAYVPHSEAIICGGADVGQPGAGASIGSAYDFGDHAGDGAFGVWQIDVFANGKPIKSISTQVTFLEQIEYMAPTEAVDALTTTLLAEGGVGIHGYHKGRVYFSPEAITEITVRARLVNYALAVYRVGWHTVSFTHPDEMGGASFCPGKDPGFFTGNNCEAPCCGNVSCLSQIFFGNKLFSTDVVRPVVTNILWEGTTTWRIPDSNNPYKTAGLGVGTLFNVFMSFDLNSPMSAWAINLRVGSG